MGKKVIDLADWEEIYEKNMNMIMKCIRNRKKELIDDTDDDYCVSALKDAYRWVDSDNQKCLLNNINTAIKEKAYLDKESSNRIKRAIKFYPPNKKNIIGLLSRSDVKYRLDEKVNKVFMDNGKSDYIVMGLDLVINGIRVPQDNIIIETVDGNIETMDKDLFKELYPNEPIE